MKPQEIQLKLESMKGRAYEYAKTVHVVNSYKINGEEFTLFTDKSTFKRKFETANDFFKYWYETPGNIEIAAVHEKIKEEANEDPPENVSLDVYERESSLANDLIAILKDNISRVQKNAGYINQAKAVNNDVNSIINIAKLKMDMYKQIKKK